MDQDELYREDPLGLGYLEEKLKVLRVRTKTVYLTVKGA